MTAVRPTGLDRSARSFVVVTAVALAAVDGFVVAALRGAVGTMSRIQALGTTWMVQSVVLLPFLLVGLALVVALAGRRTRATMLRVLVGAVLVGLAVGVGALAVDAVIDQAVQAAQPSAMAGMEGMEGMADPATSAADDVDLHVRAVGLGAAVLLAADLVVVLWAAALHCGRITRRPS